MNELELFVEYREPFNLLNDIAYFIQEHRAATIVAINIWENSGLWYGRVTYVYEEN